LAGDGGRSLPVLPHSIDQIIKKLITDLPSDKKISNADGLKRTLLLSGLFLENKLAATGSIHKGDSSAIDQDLKGNLLQLLYKLQQASASMSPQRATGQQPGIKPTPESYTSTQVKSQYSSVNNALNTAAGPVTNNNARSPTRQTSAPPLPHTPLQAQQRSTASMLGYQTSSQIVDDILHQVNGAIARLQINQIASLPGEDHIQPVLSFELPIRHEDRIDVIQIRISQDRSTYTPEKTDRWSASLAMNLESLGTVYANVTISQQQVWTSLWAEEKSTVEIINQHLQDLYRRYSKAGLSMGATRCHHGIPPAVVSNAHKILVDTNA